MKASRMGFNPEYAEDEPTLEQVNGLAADAILEFGAPWCGHCQAARPAIEEALKEETGLLHIKVHDGEGKVLGRAFRVKRWPTLILLRKGREVARLVRPLHALEVSQLLAHS
jgi:thioredoxin 1